MSSIIYQCCSSDMNNKNLLTNSEAVPMNSPNGSNSFKMESEQQILQQQYESEHEALMKRNQKLEAQNAQLISKHTDSAQKIKMLDEKIRNLYEIITLQGKINSVRDQNHAKEMVRFIYFLFLIFQVI